MQTTSCVWPDLQTTPDHCEREAGWTNRTYLPSADWQTFPRLWPKRDEKALHAAFRAVQADCSAPRYSLRLPGYGLGGSVMLFIDGLWRSWIVGTAVHVPSSPWVFADSRCSSDARWSCLLRPAHELSIDSCSIDELHGALVVHSSARTLPMRVEDACGGADAGVYSVSEGTCHCRPGFKLGCRRCDPANVSSSRGCEQPGYAHGQWRAQPGLTEWDAADGCDATRGQWLHFAHTPGLNRSVHPQQHGLWFYEQYGAMALAGAVANLLLAPQPTLRAAFAANAGRIIGSRCMGVHVRHGDSCGSINGGGGGGPRRCFPWSDYLEAMDRMRELYGVTNVFLATDDPSIASAETLADAKRRGFEIAMQQGGREAFRATTSLNRKAHAAVEKTRFNETQLEAVQVDVMGLGSCDYYVGSFRSALLLLAYDMALGRLGRAPPFISLDSAYCRRNHHHHCPDYIKRKGSRVCAAKPDLPPLAKPRGLTPVTTAAPRATGVGGSGHATAGTGPTGAG